ncbi:hypothetical protein [Chitinophaga sp. YIM B06452]|uniref:hypothetical protein n=1 Tax=Chitinophaga sp. YIM B06452 TaxID=3082158 RepID=UPI0031FEF6BD
MPVQYWHTHPEQEQAAAWHSAEVSIFGAGAQLKGDCKICDHHYSVYYDDSCGQPAPLPAVKNLSLRSPDPALSETMHLPSPNKGPPATT